MEQRDNWHLTELLHNPQGRGDPFAAAVRATRMPMVITDPGRDDNPIVFVNEAFQRLTGYDREEIIGKNCRFLQGIDTDEGEVKRLRQAIERGQAIDVDLLNYRKDGSSFWNALSLSPVRDDDGVIRFFFASQMDVTERVEAQAIVLAQKAAVDREVKSRTAELEAALEAKTILLHEVDHRVKNNLNMIGSLLRLQARSIRDPVVAGKLKAMLERLDALSAVHRRLYQGDDITRFDIGDFLASLAADILGASGRSDIRLEQAVSAILVSSAQASALGLVLNEILTNAVKHAFLDGRSGVLRIGARLDGSHGCIEIADDGPGIEAERLTESGLGYTLMTRLSRQARAEIAFGTAAPGALVTLKFPVEVQQ